MKNVKLSLWLSALSLLIGLVLLVPSTGGRRIGFRVTRAMPRSG